MEGGTMRRLIIVGVLLLVLIGGGILFYTNGVPQTSIGYIVKNPRDYDGKILTISGKVIERMSLIVVKYFQLRDDTGEIIVVSQRPLPAVGERVRVKGRVKEAFSLMDKQVLVFVEEPKEK
jgi:hypothetical protein